MAFSNTFDTTSPGSAASNREDLSDALYLLAPQATPVVSLCPKTKATATVHEWTVDALSAPSSTAVAEGSDVSAYTDKFAGVARLSNYVHELRRDFMVSNRQQAVQSAGPQDLARAEMKATLELKRDIEKTIIGTQDRAAENGAGTASTLRGLGDWLDSAGPSDVPAAYRTPSTSIHASGTFSETVLNNIITSIFRVNGMSNDLTLVADTALRRIITDFTQTTGSTNTTPRVFNQDAGSRGVVLSVEFYNSDNGAVSIVSMNPDCAPDTTNKDYGYVINPDYIALADLISLGSNRAPNLGGGDRGWVDWTGTLEVRHPGAHGVISTLS